MGKETVEIKTAEDAPLTIRDIIKWSSICGTAAAALIGCMIWIFNMKADIAFLKQQAVYHEARITAVESHENQTDKTLTDMSKKLDGAVIILDRIDRKMGEP